uniref:regulator of G-protein signaling 17-like isoform X1 n=1 Tax=Doryrhamphus excisus TaxID=161450 RepID=UPI0025AEC1E3|nr:regulator of G-protein signaling 17-like isoform X1 [Doryrhamphus excisus]
MHFVYVKKMWQFRTLCACALSIISLSFSGKNPGRRRRRRRRRENRPPLPPPSPPPPTRQTDVDSGVWSNTTGTPGRRVEDRRMCLRTRGGCRPPDLLHANIVIHRSHPGRARGGRADHGGGRLRDIGARRAGGAELDHHPQSPTTERLLLLVVLLLELHLPFYRNSLTTRNEDERRRRGRKRMSQDTKMKTIPNCEPCTEPSEQDIRLWSQSFDKLMRNPAGRNVFREFLRTEYSEENMMFWLACEDLKQEVNKARVEEKVRFIYEDYISIRSPKEVSLDAHVREVINNKIPDPTPHIFEEAQMQIYMLMYRDSYPRFLSSNIYRSLIRASSRSSSES